jgi:mono/diheme cytochrome c family protein
MRCGILIAVPAAALVLAGCGTTTVQPLPETVVGPLQVPTTTTQGPSLPKGNAAAGKSVFVTASCGACHTMSAAGSHGTVGPNLDDLKPDLAKIESQVINGGGGMPPFKGTLTDQQIADVSQYVYDSTHH